MTENFDVDVRESPIWANMFGNVPVEYDDIEEYEYVEYLESNSQGGKPSATQNRFVLYNRDVDPYLLFHKGFIQVRGYIATAATIGTGGEVYYDASDDTGQIAPCNLFNYAIWDSAELRMEGSLVQKVDQPRLIGLVKHLTEYKPENEKTQGTLSFFYKDTGDGSTSYRPITTTTGSTTANTYTLTGAVVTEEGKATKYIAVSGLADGAGKNLLDPASGLTLGVTSTTTSTSFSYENDNYNEGFVKRRNRCIARGAATKKVFEFYLPLSDLFGFYENYNAPFRGMKHEITLYKNQDPNTYLHKGGLTAAGAFAIEKISMWIPRVKPSYEKLSDLTAKFESKAQSVLKWNDYRYEISNLINQSSLSNQIRIGSLAGRPTYCYVFFQLNNTIIGDQEENKNLFSNLTNAGNHGLSQLEMRINSHALPLQTFLLDFSDDNEDYLRAYLYLLESQGKMLSDKTGMVISYEEFKKLYPIFVFDFTRIESRMYENISASELEVRWRLHAAAPDDYRCHVIIQHDRVATMQAIDTKLMITL